MHVQGKPLWEQWGCSSPSEPSWDNDHPQGLQEQRERRNNSTLVLGEKWGSDLGVMHFKGQEESPRGLLWGFPSLQPPEKSQTPAHGEQVAKPNTCLLLMKNHRHHLISATSTGEPNTWGAVIFRGNKTKLTHWGRAGNLHLTPPLESLKAVQCLWDLQRLLSLVQDFDLGGTGEVIKWQSLITALGTLQDFTVSPGKLEQKWISRLRVYKVFGTQGCAPRQETNSWKWRVQLKSLTSHYRGVNSLLQLHSCLFTKREI